MDARVHSPERRVYRRADVSQALEIFPLSSRWRLTPASVRAEMINIGCGGISATLAEPLEPGSRCRIRFGNDDYVTQTDEVEGEVRWAMTVRRRAHIGIEFDARMDVMRRPAPDDVLRAVPEWVPRRILVADDEPAVLSVLSRFLTDLGCQVDTAKDGEEALQALRHERPDVLLLDLRLPGLDGLKVLERIESEHLDVGSIWAISGYATDDEAERAMLLGASDFINKPLDLQYLEWSLSMSQLGL